MQSAVRFCLRSYRKLSESVRYLIVNADDLGLSRAINRGILEAHLDGVVSSTTVLVNMPYAREGIELIQTRAPELGLGLHINLTYGEPLSAPKDVPSLVQLDGRFVSVTRGLFSPRRWQASDVKRELTRQLEHFQALTGTLPDHLDSHQLIGSLSPTCREVMLDIAERYNLPMRRGGRATFALFEEEVVKQVPWSKRLAPRVFQSWPMERHKYIYDRDVVQPDFLETRFFDKGSTLTTLLNILGDLPPGITELVCHPGYAESSPVDAYKMREVELRILTSESVKQKLKQEKIELINFGDLQAKSLEN